MGIFEDFYDDIMSAVKSGTGTVKQTVNTAEQERIIRKMTSEIGNLIMVELDEGKQYGPAIMERYQTILEARKAIEESKKTEPEPTKKICPKCGKSNALEMSYCGFCGADMSIVPEEVAEETATEETAE